MASTGAQKGGLQNSLTRVGNVQYVAAAVTLDGTANVIVITAGVSYTITMPHAADFGVGFHSIYCEFEVTGTITIAFTPAGDPADASLTAADDYTIYYSDGRHWMHVNSIQT